jgi:hypothetical protein
MHSQSTLGVKLCIFHNWEHANQVLLLKCYECLRIQLRALVDKVVFDQMLKSLIDGIH